VGRVKSILMSNSTLDGLTLEVANSLASFRLVSAIGRGFSLLLLCCCVVDQGWSFVVIPVRFVARLGLCVGGRRFRDQVN
jgi:hypothetical protein